MDIAAASAVSSRAAPLRRALRFALPVLALGGALGSSGACSRRASRAVASDPRWQPAVTVASGPAHRGPWQMNASDYRWVDDPSVAVANDGVVAVAWVDQSHKDVFLQTFSSDGRARGAAANVSRSPAVFSWLPRVSVAPDDSSRVSVLWQEIVFSGGTHGGEIFFARSVDGGQSFSAPTNLSSTRAGAGKGRLDADTWDNGSLDLARGPGGELHAVWTEYEGALRYSRSTDDGETFAPPVLLGGSTELPARGPSVAAGPGGRVVVAWAVGEDAGGDVTFATSSDSGATFSAPRIALATRAHSDAPAVALDRRGTTHLAFMEREPGGVSGGGTGGAPGDYRIQYARLTAEAATFEPARRIAPAQNGASQTHPQVRVDASGGVYLLWDERAGGAARPTGLGFARSSDGGEAFGASTGLEPIARPELGQSGSLQGMFGEKIAVNDAGFVAVVNSTFRAGEESHVWLALAERR